ncbi:fibroblast growth factor 19 [Cololabis saira]|uniref:fibroblast growth factor 19 n=1 Tax=Cololabis saira TaxID=129043 RepID=UPI002AD3A2C8|nr:fibroblast growth factor 19 [Cololabis saira]
MLLLAVSLAMALSAAGVSCMPLSDQGPHLAHGWGQVVRLRHLYAARPGLHLHISEQGHVHGSADQSLYSLLEISPVGPGRVVIKGVKTSRFLCIERDGTLYSTHAYSRDDCTFREQILADGYNIYVSDSYGSLLSLGNQQQRLQGLDRSVPALARFLPRASGPGQLSFPPGLAEPEQPSAAQAQDTVDVMDSFGKLSQIMHSPSFHKR